MNNVQYTKSTQQFVCYSTFDTVCIGLNFIREYATAQTAIDPSSSCYATSHSPKGVFIWISSVSILLRFLKGVCVYTQSLKFVVPFNAVLKCNRFMSLNGILITHAVQILSQPQYYQYNMCFYFLYVWLKARKSSTNHDQLKSNITWYLRWSWWNIILLNESSPSKMLH